MLLPPLFAAELPAHATCASAVLSATEAFAALCIMQRTPLMDFRRGAYSLRARRAAHVRRGGAPPFS